MNILFEYVKLVVGHIKSITRSCKWEIYLEEKTFPKFVKEFDTEDFITRLLPPTAAWNDSCQRLPLWFPIDLSRQSPSNSKPSSLARWQVAAEILGFDVRRAAKWHLSWKGTFKKRSDYSPALPHLKYISSWFPCVQISPSTGVRIELTLQKMSLRRFGSESSTWEKGRDWDALKVETWTFGKLDITPFGCGLIF